MTGLLSVKAVALGHAMSTAASQICGHKYAGHCPARQNVALTDTTKSRAGKRIVPLPGAIVDLLLAHRESQSVERQRAAQLWSEEGWIFADETGRAVNPRTDWDGWKRLLATAGVRDGRLHDARHTAAESPAARRPRAHDHERLGWSTTAMASRLPHVITPIHSDLASRLDGLLWSSRDASIEPN